MQPVADVRGFVPTGYQDGPGLINVGSFVQLINRSPRELHIQIDGRYAGTISPGRYDSFVIYPGATNIRVFSPDFESGLANYSATSGQTLYLTVSH